MLKVLVVMLPSSRNIVTLWVGGLSFLHKREGQCSEGTDPAGCGRAPGDLPKGVSIFKGPGPCSLAGKESKDSFGHPKQG